jgi:hypothetical protein
MANSKIYFENTDENKFIKAFLEMKQKYLTGCLPEESDVIAIVRKNGKQFCIQMEILSNKMVFRFESSHRSPFLAAENATDHLRDEILKQHYSNYYL